MMKVDGDAVHFRDRRGRAADGEKRQQPEGPGERPDIAKAAVHAAASFRMVQATAMLRGIATRRTGTKGQRNRPMAAKTETKKPSATGSRRFTSGHIIRPATPITSPTAAHETPARVRCSAGISP